VSGALGAAFLGLQVLERERLKFEQGSTDQQGLEQYKMLVGSYLRPELAPQLPVLLEEAKISPSFGYFITRGLSDALLRLHRDSGLGVKVYADKIPFEGGSFALGKELNLDPVSAAMNGGEDDQLLFVVPIAQYERFRKDFQAFDIIGHLARPEVGAVLVSPDGLEHPVSAPGWTPGATEA
jgi:thiamine-monophosphate kinase